MPQLFMVLILHVVFKNLEISGNGFYMAELVSLVFEEGKSPWSFFNDPIKLVSILG